MALRTPICDLLGIDAPIGNAGMAGGHANAALAAAVSNAGALGGISGIYREGPERLRQEIRRTRELTTKPFSVNLWCFVLDQAPQLLDVCIEERVPSVTLSFGPPGVHAERAKKAGMLVLHQVQTVARAREAVASGAVDVIIAQGGEAGGHTGSVATMALVPQAVDVAGVIPVIAAGGIGDGRGLVAALALGAQGVIMGTRFVASMEAGSTPRHQKIVVGATADDTVFTDVFDIVDGMTWPQGISGRVIRTPFTDEWHGREGDLAAQRGAILAESPIPNEAPERAQSSYAGQSAGLVRHVQPAADIVATIVREAEAVLASLARK
jgi:NAD(P)H-dependent flavin oxidoreductase YrpB (nitropropane dioxygenase family)